MPGDGTARTNPVHPLDVAEACVDALGMDSGVSVPVGGPDILTRNELARLAFRAVGKPARIIHAPRPLVVAAGTLAGLVHPHTGDVIDFAARVFTSECVAPCRGHRPLAEYFAQVVAGRTRAGRKP
jgi:uncharacterized protein YbjT (DUF2867 family)